MALAQFSSVSYGERMRPVCVEPYPHKPIDPELNDSLRKIFSIPNETPCGGMVFARLGTIYDVGAELRRCVQGKRWCENGDFLTGEVAQINLPAEIFVETRLSAKNGEGSDLTFTLEFGNEHPLKKVQYTSVNGRENGGSCLTASFCDVATIAVLPNEVWGRLQEEETLALVTCGMCDNLQETHPTSLLLMRKQIEDSVNAARVGIPSNGNAYIDEYKAVLERTISAISEVFFVVDGFYPERLKS